MLGVRERPPPLSETSMAGPLRGDASSPGAPTTYVENVDGRPLGPLGGPVSIQDSKVCCDLHR
jgi:hypothetical protein